MTEDGSSLRGNRDYKLYWAAGAISNLGTQLSVLAYPMLVLALGGSAAQAGAVGTVSLVARMVLRLPGGHVTDRLAWRRLMIAMDLVRLVAVGSVPLAAALDGLRFPQLLGVAIIEGSASAFFRPAASVALRDIVSAEQLPSAFSLGQSRAAAVSLVGPVLGGALFTVDRVLPFALDAATYAVSTVLLLALRTERGDSRTGGGQGDKRVTAGLRWLGGQPEVVRVLAFAAVINLVGAGAEVAVIITLRRHGTSGGVVGAVMACAGVGAVVGSVLAPRLLKRLESGRLYTVVGVLWAAGLGAFAADPSAAVIAPLLVLMMMATPAVGIRLGQTTVGQAPRELLGRISMAEETVTGTLASVGPLAAGAVIQGFGVTAAWTAMAVLCALAPILATSVIGRAVAAREEGRSQAEPSPVPDHAG